jgi:hypothetical protein
MSVLFATEYRGQKDSHWLYYILDKQAGLTLLPIYIVASISLAESIFNKEYMATSRENYVMVATLAAIMAWYTLILVMVYGVSFNFNKEYFLSFLFIILIFGVICFNYLIFLININKIGRLQPVNSLFIYVWFSTLIVSILAKYPLAKEVYNQLPEVPPNSDCFIVSAAANGHPSIVQSWFEPNIGKPVNYQWYVFKTFEAMLANYYPWLHRRLRLIYNWIAPCIAKQIHYRWQADMVYLLLKPLEWIVRFGLVLTRNSILK